MKAHPKHSIVSRLRIKFDNHEFEAEGDEDFVQHQFERFRMLVAPERAVDNPVVDKERETAVSLAKKIMRIRGHILSLSVPARSADAVLALMLGQKQFRNNHRVSGVEIMSGLRDSEIRIPRADGILSKHMQDGYIQWTGSGRARRYSLTESGSTHAEEIIRQLAR
jgi:hypothetical protein